MADAAPKSPKVAMEAMDDHLGREAALVANEILNVTDGLTRVVGWTVGDARLQARSGVRGIIPMHLRVSARVHHVAFFHPSLDTKTAVKKLAETGGMSPGSEAEAMCEMENLVLAEKNRISRDGIIQDHFKNVAAAGKESDDRSTKPKGARRLVMLSYDPDRQSKSTSLPIPRPIRKVAYGVSGGEAKKQRRMELEKSMVNAHDRRRSMVVDNKEDSDDIEVEIFDFKGAPGTGPAFASLLVKDDVARIGRYLPEVACRVPRSAVCFELRSHSSRKVKSTQPFVVEAPHVIWGSARDQLLYKVAANGSQLIDPRGIEYLPNNELDLAENSESLLIFGATVWVDVPLEIKADAKTSKDAAKVVIDATEKTAKKGMKIVKKVGKLMHSPASSGVGAHSDTHSQTRKGSKVFKKAAKALRIPKRKGKEGSLGTGGDASMEGDGESVSVGTLTSESGNKRSSISTINDDEEESDVFLSARQEIDRKDSLARSDDAVVAHRGDNEVGIRLPPNELRARLPPSDQIDGISEVTTSRQRQSSSGDVADQTVTEAPLLIEEPSPYVLVLDEKIEFRVCSFPSGDTLAKFPVSVASILNERSMEDRLSNPRHPSELTVTLVQEPRMDTGQWGVEATVTFRVCEVKPKLPLQLTEPVVDDTGKRVRVDKKLKDIKARFKHLDKSKEEIEKAIKAAEEEAEAEELAIDAAIIAAGLGRGFEEGAPPQEIIERQMFYDPDRVLLPLLKRQELLNDTSKLQLVKNAAVAPFDLEISQTSSNLSSGISSGGNDDTISPKAAASTTTSVNTTALVDNTVDKDENFKSANQFPLKPRTDDNTLIAESPPATEGGAFMSARGVSDGAFTQTASTEPLIGGVTPGGDQFRSAKQSHSVAAVSPSDTSVPGEVPIDGDRFHSARQFRSNVVNNEKELGSAIRPSAFKSANQTLSKSAELQIDTKSTSTEAQRFVSARENMATSLTSEKIATLAKESYVEPEFSGFDSFLRDKRRKKILSSSSGLKRPPSSSSADTEVAWRKLFSSAPSPTIAKPDVEDIGLQVSRSAIDRKSRIRSPAVLFRRNSLDENPLHRSASVTGSSHAMKLLVLRSVGTPRLDDPLLIEKRGRPVHSIDSRPFIVRGARWISSLISSLMERIRHLLMHDYPGLFFGFLLCLFFVVATR